MGVVGLTAALVSAAGTPSHFVAASPVASRVSVAIIGDSILAGNMGYLSGAFDQLGVPPRFVDAKSDRRTSAASAGVRRVPSGREVVRSLRGQGLQPDLWVVWLGSNDTYFIRTCGCPDPVAFAGAYIDALRAELPPDARVLWVNLRTSSPAALAYNTALARRAGPQFVVADWRTFTASRSDWFIDGVHPNLTGVRKLAEFLSRAILAASSGPSAPSNPTPVPDRCAPSPLAAGPDQVSVTGSTVESIGGGAVATVAARRCRL